MNICVLNKNKNIPLSLFYKYSKNIFNQKVMSLERLACYAGLLLPPVEGFSLCPMLFSQQGSFQKYCE